MKSTQHRGVQTLEQRQSVGITEQSHCKLRSMTEKEGTTMAKSNNSESLRSRVDLVNLFLLALHVGVVGVSLWAHPILGKPADRALPYVV
jgi:hypothetical protein